MERPILDALYQAIVDMKYRETRSLAEEGLKQGIAAIEILNHALLKGIEEVGDRFGKEEIYLPELLLSVRAYEQAFKIIHPRLLEGQYSAKGKVIIGTVAGDLHDIGKNIVAALLEGNGFEVIDLGVDVKEDVFIGRVEELQPDVLAMSSLLTTTMTEMERVIEHLERQGMKDLLKVVVGGAPVTASFAEQIGADGYGGDAQEAVALVKSLLGCS